MATVTTIPALVLPDKPTQLVFTANAGGNLVKVWCTSAPRGSKLREQLDASQSERVVVISESDIGKRPQYTFDVGGTYVLQVEEFSKGAETYGGRYRNDPDGYRTESRLAINEASVNVLSLMQVEVGVSPDVANLQIYVSGDDILETTIATHGFSSPSILKQSTAKMRAVVDTPSVIAALEELGGSSATDAIGDLSAIVTDLIDKFNGHRVEVGYHEAADNYELISASFRNPLTVASIARSLAACLQHFSNHVQNIDPDPAASHNHGPGTGAYHVDNEADWRNLPIAAGGNTMAACWVLASDLHRCFGAHLTSEVHITPDDVWTLEPLPPLGELHTSILAELAALSPTTPPNEHAAKVLLVNGAGFKEV